MSMSLGISLRSTMDIDFLVRKMNMSEEVVVNTLKEVASIDVGDDVRFEFLGIGN